MTIKFGLMLILGSLTLFTVSCSSEPRPTRTARTYWELMDKGDCEGALRLFSKRWLEEQAKVGGFDVKGCRDTSERIKGDGGIKSIEIQREDIAGDIAEVDTKLTRNKPSLQGQEGRSIYTFKLIKEGSEWKLDGIVL